MIPLIWIRGIIATVLLSSIMGLGYLGYSKIKAIGYQEASAKYEERIKEYNSKVLAKVEAIEQNSIVLSEEARTNNAKLQKNITSVVSTMKGKTLTIVKNGECTPSKTFTDSFNQINHIVNENIKEAQK